MVALAFLIKVAGAERGSSRKLKGEMKLESTDRIPFWRQAGSGRGRGAGGGGQRLGRLRRSIQAGIIEASSASRPSWEVGNCCAGFGLAQLGTEARHCEMYSNLAHFLCLPGMSHYSSIAGKKKKKKSCSWLALLLCSLPPPLPALRRKEEEMNRRGGAPPGLDLEEENDPRRPGVAGVIFPCFIFLGIRTRKFNGVVRFMFCLLGHCTSAE